jgi:hypothetical protein
VLVAIGVPERVRIREVPHDGRGAGWEQDRWDSLSTNAFVAKPPRTASATASRPMLPDAPTTSTVDISLAKMSSLHVPQNDRSRL